MVRIIGDKMGKLKISKLKEYSKRCIAAMIVLWFAVALFGIGVNIYQLGHTETPETVMIDSLYGYVGLPMTAMENKEKIKGNVSSNEEILSQVYEQEEEDNEN